jgi:hypothetical protein
MVKEGEEGVGLWIFSWGADQRAYEFVPILLFRVENLTEAKRESGAHANAYHESARQKRGGPHPLSSGLIRPDGMKAGGWTEN